MEGGGLRVGEERKGRKSPNVHTYTWLALCSANSQIVLSRSKAECDREGLHTRLKLPLTLPCFCLAVHENYIIKDIWHIRGYIHCSELII